MDSENPKFASDQHNSANQAKDLFSTEEYKPANTNAFPLLKNVSITYKATVRSEQQL